MLADGLTQGRQSGGGGVAGTTIGQGALPGGNDRRGTGEIRLADFHVHDAAARRFQFMGTRQQGHDVKGRDISRAPRTRQSRVQNVRPRSI